MFGAMKKAMAVAAVVGVSALAPAIASADEWYADGVTVGGTPGVAAIATGSLSFTVPVGGGVTATTTCDVEVTVDLFNQAGVAHGDVTSFDVPNPGGCTVSSNAPSVIGDCVVTGVVSNVSTPWTISTSGTSGTISGVNFTNTYATAPGGNPCALTGSKVITGSVTGSWTNPGTLSFSNAAGLTVNPGSLPASVNGSVFIEGEAGETITLG